MYREGERLAKSTDKIDKRLNSALVMATCVLVIAIGGLVYTFLLKEDTTSSNVPPTPSTSQHTSSEEGLNEIELEADTFIYEQIKEAESLYFQVKDFAESGELPEKETIIEFIDIAQACYNNLENYNIADSGNYANDAKKCILFMVDALEIYSNYLEDLNYDTLVSFLNHAENHDSSVVVFQNTRLSYLISHGLTEEEATEHLDATAEYYSQYYGHNIT